LLPQLSRFLAIHPLFSDYGSDGLTSLFSVKIVDFGWIVHHENLSMECICQLMDVLSTLVIYNSGVQHNSKTIQ